MNYKLRELASRQKFIGASQTFSYTASMQIGFDNPERILKQRMAEKVAHTIADDIMHNGTWQHRREPEGEVYSVKGVWLDYDTLYRLLEEAYALGLAELAANPFVYMKGDE